MASINGEEFEQASAFLKAYCDATEDMMARGRPPPSGRTHYTAMGWIAERGQAYESQPLTDAELEWLFYLLDDHGGRYQVQQCFYNSQLVALWSDREMFDRWGEHGLVYVEGYALGVIPVHHGWLSLNGKVVDLTMRLPEPLRRQSPQGRGRLRNRVLGEFPADRGYFGVPFPVSYVRECMRLRQYLGSLIDDWKNDYPLLRAV